jgi:hypothetical protein
LNTDKGKAVVTNASIQVLFKQSVSAIDRLTEVFFLSEGERNLLLSANVGEGLFFAGEAHVAMQVIASQDEHEIITTNPAELEAIERAKQLQEVENISEERPTEEAGEFEFGTSVENEFTSPPPETPTVPTETAPNVDEASGVIEFETPAEQTTQAPPETANELSPQQIIEQSAEELASTTQESPEVLTSEMLDNQTTATPETAGQVDTEERPEGTVPPSKPTG